MNIVLLDGFTLNPGDISWKSLADLGTLTVYDRTEEDAVYEKSKDADILLVNKIRITSELIQRLPKLKFIGVLATGYNIVDIIAARKQNIVVCNVPNYSTESVAQIAFAHLLNITNRIEYYAKANSEGRWSKCNDFCYWDGTLSELYGKTIGIVGFGNIGNAIARIAHAFQMKICAYTSKKEENLPEYVEKTTLDDLFSNSDVISLNCPLTPETEYMINSLRLKMMKKTAILLNTARGKLVDEQALAHALNTGEIGAYGCDVLTEEPPTSENPLFAARNTFITPHQGWATIEARTRLLSIVVENIRSFLNGNPINVVN